MFLKVVLNEKRSFFVRHELSGFLKTVNMCFKKAKEEGASFSFVHCKGFCK